MAHVLCPQRFLHPRVSIRGSVAWHEFLHPCAQDPDARRAPREEPLSPLDVLDMRLSVGYEWEDLPSLVKCYLAERAQEYNQMQKQKQATVDRAESVFSLPSLKDYLSWSGEHINTYVLFRSARTQGPFVRMPVFMCVCMSVFTCVFMCVVTTEREGAGVLFRGGPCGCMWVSVLCSWCVLGSVCIMCLCPCALMYVSVGLAGFVVL